MLSREEQRLWQQAWHAGAEAEHARLTPRINLLKDAVAERDTQLRKLRRALAHSAAELAALETANREAAARIADLERVVESDGEKLDYWTWWAWGGQPAAVGVDAKIYEAKIANLERAVAYWERRVLSASPATTQAMADRDAMVKYSCSHLSLRQIREALEA